MAKGIFTKFRGTMTSKELHSALEGMLFRDRSKEILHQFFVEGRRPIDIAPSNLVNNTIDRFLKNLANKGVHPPSEY